MERKYKLLVNITDPDGKTETIHRHGPGTLTPDLLAISKPPAILNVEEHPDDSGSDSSYTVTLKTENDILEELQGTEIIVDPEHQATHNHDKVEITFDVVGRD